MSGLSAVRRHEPADRVCRRRLLGLAAVALGATALAACQGAPARPPAPTSGAAPATAPTATTSTAATGASTSTPGVTPGTASPTTAPVTNTTATAKPANQGGTLIVAADQLYEDYVPATDFQGWAGIWIIDNVFETLYAFRDFSGKVQPALATSYTVSDDGLTYTF